MLVRNYTLPLSMNLYNSVVALIQNDAHMDKKTFARARAEGASEVLNVFKKKTFITL